MRIKWLFPILLAYSLPVFADVGSDFAAYSQDAKGMGNMMQVGNSGISVKRVVNGQAETTKYQAGDIPSATQNPEASAYYNQDLNVMVNAGRAELSNNAAGSLVDQKSKEPKQYVIDPNDPSVARNLLIQEDAPNLAQGVSGKYINCQATNGGNGMICGDDFFCVKGDCSEVTKSSNPNFGKDVTEMAAVKAGVSDTEPNPHSVRAFTGQGMTCKDEAFGALNCCQDSGWANGLLHCSAEEHRLGEAKEKGLAIEVGSYCSHRIWRHCTEHKKGYCVFSNHLAYDVQVHGRMEQLGQGFGGADHLDCSGLSIETLQQIHFDRIDFSNAVDEVTSQANFPNSDAVEKAIVTDVHNQLGGH